MMGNFIICAPHQIHIIGVIKLREIGRACSRHAEFLAEYPKKRELN
jgi:hypothetical protein